MEHLVEVSYRRHRLALVESDNNGRVMMLDVWLDRRYRGGLRGVLSPIDLTGRTDEEIADPCFVALVARCAGEGLRSEVLVNRAALDAGIRGAVWCGAYLHRVFDGLVLPGRGAVVMSFTTHMSESEEAARGMRPQHRHASAQDDVLEFSDLALTGRSKPAVSAAWAGADRREQSRS